MRRVTETKTPPPPCESFLTLFHTLEHLWKARRSALTLSSLQQHNGGIIGIWDAFPSPGGCAEVHLHSAWDHLHMRAPPHAQPQKHQMKWTFFFKSTRKLWLFVICKEIVSMYPWTFSCDLCLTRPTETWLITRVLLKSSCIGPLKQIANMYGELHL